MRAIFLDRDGVINVNRDDHVKSWDEFTFLPGALTALRWLQDTGFRVFVVTNQGVISHGGATHTAIAEIHRKMCAEIQLLGGAIDEIVYCPHAGHEQCRCRKPSPGMLLDLAAALEY